MAKLFEYYQEWLEHDGKTIVIDGLSYKLEVRTYEAVYPFKAQVISVYANPVSKNSKHYQESKKALGDDWSTNVLDSSIELQVDILRQLGA